MKMRLSDIALATKGDLKGEDCELESVSIDSRDINPGDAFVAIRGARFDGHAFVDAAQRLGASAAIVDFEQKDLAIPQVIVSDTVRALGEIAALKRKRFTGKVVAVTGSSGKTSVKGMLANVLSEKGSTLATAGNLNNHIGVPLTLLRLDDHDFAVVELGTSAAGEIAYLTNLIDPDVAVVTNVMPAHIGGFGSLQAIAEEKSCVYAAPGLLHAVINFDDAFHSVFLAKAECSNILGFSLNKDESRTGVYATDVTFNGSNCACFDLCFNKSRAPVQLSVPGLHSVQNALAASACAIALGLTVEDVASTLGRYSGDKGRMQVKKGFRQSTLIDDTYNANLGSVKAAIDVLVKTKGPRVLILGELGELGELSEQTHIEIGNYAREKGVGTLATLGDVAKLAAQAFGEGGIGFDSKADLVETIKKKYLGSEVTVLVKGSRFTKMEEVIKQLEADVEVSEC